MLTQTQIESISTSMDTIRSKSASLKQVGFRYQKHNSQASKQEQKRPVSEPVVMEKIASPRPKPAVIHREEPMSMEEMRRQLGLNRVVEPRDDSKSEQQREQIMSEIMESTTRMRHLGCRSGGWGEWKAPSTTRSRRATWLWTRRRA